MNRLRHVLPLLLFLPIIAYAQAPAPANDRTALDKYIEMPDPSYKYDLVGKTAGGTHTTYVLRMTSQTWRSAGEVDRNVWWHWMIIVRPNEVKHTKGLLYISGGNNNSAAPKDADGAVVQIALATRSVVTELRMVPNQPLAFSDDKKPRTEDEMIAYTWDKYLKTGDEMWPARLPMTKAAVRAMDTITSFCGSAEGGGVRIDGFVVAGGSKRGWTTWTTAAVDRRVVGIIPLVIDMLNVVPSFRHHYAVYGYYAPAVNDYEEMGLMNKQDSPQYRELMKIVEPYEYRHRMTMPKFIINATGDQFFVPDSWQFYFNDLPGVKYLRYVPNAEHSLRGSDAWASVTACYNSILTGAKTPQFDWRIEKDGTIRVKAADKPTEVKLWQATNPGARDFRLTSIGLKWKATTLQPQGESEYTARVAPPRRGWTAYMVELTFPSGLALAPFKFTTGVKILPDALPFAEESKSIGKK
ncbi:MAG: PhoPQ-activated pathogenicity-related family protein [Blastocatellia bacterium]